MPQRLGTIVEEYVTQQRSILTTPVLARPPCLASTKRRRWSQGFRAALPARHQDLFEAGFEAGQAEAGSTGSDAFGWQCLGEACRQSTRSRSNSLTGTGITVPWGQPRRCSRSTTSPISPSPPAPVDTSDGILDVAKNPARKLKPLTVPSPACR